MWGGGDLGATLAGARQAQARRRGCPRGVVGAEAGSLKGRAVLEDEQGVPHAKAPSGAAVNTWPSRPTTRPWNTVRRTRPTSSLPAHGQLRERLGDPPRSPAPPRPRADNS